MSGLKAPLVTSCPPERNSSSTARTRLVRFDLVHTGCPLDTADQFCNMAQGVSYNFEQRGYITLTNLNGFSVYSLKFPMTDTCLAHALAGELSERDWLGVSKVSLSLYVVGQGDRPLNIFPVNNAVPLSAIGSQATSFGSAILHANEDSVHELVRQILAVCGPCFHSVLLDAFAALVAARRLDVARCLLQSIKRLTSGITRRMESQNHLHHWLLTLEGKSHEIFRWHNDGAELKF